MEILRIDHLVLTVRDLEETASFYQRVLGLERVRFGADRLALRFGRQKINLQTLDAPSPPMGGTPTPGSADFCLVTDEPTERAIPEHVLPRLPRASAFRALESGMDALWMRQMVLGPGSEFCLQSTCERELPHPVETVAVDLETIWSP